LLAFFFGYQVDLVDDQPAWLVVERGIVFAQFFENRPGIMHRVGCRVERGDVHQMQQQSRALQVAQERWPSPAPSDAPSIRPGMSAMTKLRLCIDAHYAEVRMQCGEGIVGDLGRAAETARMKVDLPALGKPSRPTSASTFSSSLSSRRSPSRPASICRGARLVLDLKWRLPRPPDTALGDQGTLAVSIEVGDDSPVSISVMTVPTGMRSSMSSPPLP
jgi:hypothetical protein